MSQLVKTKRQANFKDFKRFGAFKGLVEHKNVFNSFVCKLVTSEKKRPNLHTNSLNNTNKNYFLNRARDNTFFNALVSADKGYTPLNLSDNIISDIVKPNIPDTIANIKQKSLHGRYFKELEQPEVNIQASHAWLKKSNIHPETEGFIFAIQDRVINTRNYKKHICGLQSIIDKCRICGTEGETIEHIISSCTVLAQSEYKKRHDIFAKIIHMNLAVKFNLLKEYTTTL
jgi:hypothetical protein